MLVKCILFEGGITVSERPDRFTVLSDPIERNTPVRIIKLSCRNYNLPIVKECDLKEAHGIMREYPSFNMIPPKGYISQNDEDIFVDHIAPQGFFRYGSVDLPKEIYNLLIGFDRVENDDNPPYEITMEMVRNFRRDYM